MGFCTDKAATYLQKFGFNVVRLPSSGIRPLQIIGEYRGAIGIVGDIADLVVKTSLPPPKVEHDIEASNINGQRTSKMPIGISGSILDGIFAGMGGNGRASGSYDGAYALEFQFEGVKRDQAKLTEIGRYLQDQDIDWDNIVLRKYLFGAGNLYIIRDVIKSRCFSVAAYDRSGKDFKIEASALQSAATAEVSVAHRSAAHSVIRYEGKIDLVFGFIADAFFAVDDPQTGFLALGFDPVKAGQIALSPSTTRSGGQVTTRLAEGVLSELKFVSPEDLGK